MLLTSGLILSSTDELISAYQHLINTSLIWNCSYLQVEHALDLIKKGICTTPLN